MADVSLTLLVPNHAMPVGGITMTPAVVLQLGVALRGERGADAPQLVYLQATEPVAASPFVWFKTDPDTGRLIDILKG